MDFSNLDLEELLRQLSQLSFLPEHGSPYQPGQNAGDMSLIRQAHPELIHSDIEPRTPLQSLQGRMPPWTSGSFQDITPAYTPYGSDEEKKILYQQWLLQQHQKKPMI